MRNSEHHRGSVFVALQDHGHGQGTIKAAHHVAVTRKQRHILFGGSSGKALGVSRVWGLNADADLTRGWRTRICHASYADHLMTPTRWVFDSQAAGWLVAGAWLSCHHLTSPWANGWPSGDCELPGPGSRGLCGCHTLALIAQSAQPFSQILCNLEKWRSPALRAQLWNVPSAWVTSCCNH